MPPRLSKRQQRELKELEELKPVDVESASEEEQAPRKGGAISFAALSAGVASEEEESEGEKPAQKKSKKKKKKSGAATPSTPPVPKKIATSEPPPAPLSKKADKKAKARQKKAEQDSFDSALAELSNKYPELKNVASSSQTSSSSLDEFARLLAVSVGNLDPEAELRKFFGAKVLKAHKAEGRQSAHSRRLAAAAPTVRSQLTNPPKEWALARQPREGLTARSLTEDEMEERRVRHHWGSSSGPTKEVWWTVECSKRYKRLTKRFMHIVATGDPNAFMGLLYGFPWHIDTLLQQSEIARHREEHSVASELLSRALFSYELPLQLSPFTFTSGFNRLDFDHVENRPFFLAVHRNVMDLTRRGLFKTAFEFTRLLYSLDPWEDPHGALFWLDWLTIRAGLESWLLDVFDYFDSHPPSNAKVNPAILPGWLYSRALATRMKEGGKVDSGSSKSTELLKDAVSNFPQVVPLLADKADIRLSSNIRGRSEFRIAPDASGLSTTDATAHLLSHLYVLRAHALWKDPKIASWFSSTLESSFEKTNNARFRRFSETYTNSTPNQNSLHAVYRHVMTIHSSSPTPAHRSLLAFIPLNLDVLASSLACDPAPPRTKVSAYDSVWFADVDTSPEDGRAAARRAGRMLERMIADPATRAQLQPLFAVRPDLLELLEALQQGNMDQLEVLNDIILEAAQIEQGFGAPGVGAMPGGDALFGPADIDQIDDIPPAGDGEAEEEEQEDSDEEDDTPALPVRVLRNLMGRLWGTANAVDNESSDEGANELNDDID